MRLSVRVALLCVVLLCPALQAQDVPISTNMGTIESLEQDDGYITISGRRLGFSDSVTQIFWEERQLGAEKLDQGMVVRYTLDAAGILQRVEILGPASKLQEIDLH